MKKRLLSLLLCTVMLLSVLTGCGKKDEGFKGGELPADDPSKHITFSYWMYADDYKLYNSLSENPVVQYLNDKFNVTMEFQTPAMGSEADNFSLMLGTQDYTDVMDMQYNTTSLSTLYEDGVIVDLAPYIEKYMPNYWRILQSNEEVRRVAYDNEGHIFKICILDDVQRNHWGGLVYRRDILETMTGGYVSFPSGNDEPTTVEDWDYMLPLMKQYFEYSGMPDTACLIIPAVGYTMTGEIQSGWGATGIFGLSTDLKTVEFGPATDNFYNYVAKMHEWYEAGYIYQDFASRTNDLFYLPNTSLTYGGAAGAWFGILQQVGDYMNMEGDGWKLEFDVRAVQGPLDTEHGITEDIAGTHVSIDAVGGYRCISTACTPEKLIRILTVMDYLYSEEGYFITQRGLTPELAANDAIYQKVGLADGAWWDNGDGTWSENPKTQAEDWPDYGMSLTGQRLNCGTGKHYADASNAKRTHHNDDEDAASAMWLSRPNTRAWPNTVELSAEENATYTKYFTAINDYVSSMIPKFIIGTESLTPESWESYVNQLKTMGLDEVLADYQTAYDRYMSK